MIVYSLIVIKSNLKEHTELLDTILKTIEQFISKSDIFVDLGKEEIDFSELFPMTSLEELTQLEKKLTNKDFLDKVVSLMKTIFFRGNNNSY